MILSDVRFHLENLKLRISSTKNVFEDIYHKRSWGDSPSVSGTGSDLKQTRIILRKIPQLINKYKIKSMLDAPCGDFFWLKSAKFNLKKYIGLDIVDYIISKNNSLYKNRIRSFNVGNIINDNLPNLDMIFCRDCLVHFSNRDIYKTIMNFKNSGAKYLLTTTFPRHPRNPNIPTGRWRPIDLQSPPFYFPKPLEMINEGCTEVNGEFRDKSLALWKLDDIGKKPFSRSEIDKSKKK